jgi:ACS family hexuronate transporter-like MFS transporter
MKTDSPTAAAEVDPFRRSRLRIPGLRWIIAVALLLAAMLNYIDRVVLGLLAPTVQKELGISDDQYANITSWFLVAYTISYLVSGRLVDKVGTRLSMAFFVAFWSVANAATALASSAMSLGVCRFFLGLAEAGGFTASPKAVSEWFSARERGIAVGMYSIGGSIGATVAPFIVLGIAGAWHWQAAFVVTGLLGLVWVVPWLWLYRLPERHPHITESELAQAPKAVNGASIAEPIESEWQMWLAVFRRSDVWLLMVARMLTDPVWYFFQFWMPKYLNTVREVKQEELGVVWVIFLAADIGFLAGGFISGQLIRRGKSAPAGRLYTMLLSACLIPLAPLIALAPSVSVALGIAMIVVLAHCAWLSNISTLVVDILPRNRLATAFGVIAAGSALGGIFMNQLVAYLIHSYSYNHCFYIMAFVHPAAWLMLFASGLVKRSDRDTVTT